MELSPNGPGSHAVGVNDAEPVLAMGHTRGVPPEESWVYLDTNVLISMARALSGSWSPPSDLTKTDRLHVAAARIRFYASAGTSSGNGRYLATSGEARAELGTGRPQPWQSVVKDAEKRLRNR
jgi:hypothetical protein